MVNHILNLVPAPVQVEKYSTTLETLLFTQDLDPNILDVFHQFVALRMWTPRSTVVEEPGFGLILKVSCVDGKAFERKGPYLHYTDSVYLRVSYFYIL